MGGPSVRDQQAMCPLVPSAAQRVLSDAALLGAEVARPVATDGTLIAEVGSAARLTAPLQLAEPVVVRAAEVARVHVIGPRPMAPMLGQAARLTAARLGEAWSAAEEVSSLAAEIVHAYEELHLIYELAEVLTSQLTAAEATNLILGKILNALRAGSAELRLADGSTVTRGTLAPSA